MDKNDFWTTVREKNTPPSNGAGALKAALIFSAVIIGAAMIVAPMLSNGEGQVFAGRQAGRFDTLTTGSVPQQAERTYTVRRSITQPMPDALCIIDSAGHHRGAC